MKCKRNTIPATAINEIKLRKTLIIGFFGEKGGSAKSTAAYQHLNIFAKSGLKVKAIDTDPQGTLYNQWSRLTQGANSFQKMKYFDYSNIFEVNTHDINLDLKSVLSIANKDGYDVIIIDTPSHLSENHRRILSQCDLAIFTFNDSEDDIATNPRVKLSIDNARFKYGKVAQSFSLITEQPNTPAARAEELEQDWEDGGYNSTHPLLNSRIINRQIYRDVKRTGLAVGDISGKPGTQANNEQIAVLVELLERSNHSQAMAS